MRQIFPGNVSKDSFPAGTLPAGTLPAATRGRGTGSLRQASAAVAALDFERQTAVLAFTNASGHAGVRAFLLEVITRLLGRARKT